MSVFNMINGYLSHTSNSTQSCYSSSYKPPIIISFLDSASVFNTHTVNQTVWKPSSSYVKLQSTINNK